MSTTVVLDKAGRLVIPKSLREELHLGPGDALQLENHGEQITLRPIRSTMPIRKEDGVWVYRSGHPSRSDIHDLIEEGRDERLRSNLGLDR